MGSSFDYYNLIEKCLLEVKLSDIEKKQEAEYDVQNKIIKEIKGLAMCLSRFKPADWNKFLDVVIKWEDNLFQQIWSSEKTKYSYACYPFFIWYVTLMTPLMIVKMFL